MRLSVMLRLPKAFSPSPTAIRNLSEFAPKALRSLKAKSTRDMVQHYVDSCRVRAVGGRGGDGCISFLSAWCKDRAGPDGGDGGHGGHVLLQASHSKKSLNHCNSVIQAKHGENGTHKDCCGKNAQHVVVEVPLGTVVRDSTGRVVGDLRRHGAVFVAARGGAGGRGNRFFASASEQAPAVAECGAQGETQHYALEVRSVARLGLVGFPNAGKSTLLRAVTRARPAVAPYPFTTRHPHIGVIPYDDHEQVTVADLPGLVVGSHREHGLGVRFLRHAERCRALVFVLDGCADPRSQYAALCHEVAQYSTRLAARPRCLLLNKIDEPRARAAYRDLKGELDVIPISAKTGLNLAAALKVFRQFSDADDDDEI